MSSHVIFNLVRNVSTPALLEDPQAFFQITKETRQLFSVQDIRIFGIKILEKYKAIHCKAIAHFF